ncbi:MAG: hypothetical protein WC624_00275 [Candidatus Margulisiibacteriota bacterium]
MGIRAVSNRIAYKVGQLAYRNLTTREIFRAGAEVIREFPVLLNGLQPAYANVNIDRRPVDMELPAVFVRGEGTAGDDLVRTFPVTHKSLEAIENEMNRSIKLISELKKDSWMEGIAFVMSGVSASSAIAAGSLHAFGLLSHGLVLTLGAAVVTAFFVLVYFGSRNSQAKLRSEILECEDRKMQLLKELAEYSEEVTGRTRLLELERVALSGELNVSLAQIDLVKTGLDELRRELSKVKQCLETLQGNGKTLAENGPKVDTNFNKDLERLVRISQAMETSNALTQIDPSAPDARALHSRLWKKLLDECECLGPVGKAIKLSDDIVKGRAGTEEIDALRAELKELSPVERAGVETLLLKVRGLAGQTVKAGGGGENQNSREIARLFSLSLALEAKGEGDKAAVARRWMKMARKAEKDPKK